MLDVRFRKVVEVELMISFDILFALACAAETRAILVPEEGHTPEVQPMKKESEVFNDCVLQCQRSVLRFLPLSARERCSEVRGDIAEQLLEDMEELDIGLFPDSYDHLLLTYLTVDQSF